MVVHDVGLGAQRVEDAPRDGPGGAVGDVETDLHALEAELGHGDEVADVAVAPGDVVDGAADFLAGGGGDGGLAVDEVLDLEDGLFVHLLAVAVEELDAVVVERVVGGGDHDAAVEVVHPRDVGDGGGGGDVHDVGVGAAGHQAGAERVFEHVAGAAGVLADDDLGLLAEARAVVPAEVAADLDGVLEGQVLVGFPAEAVGSEIFAHFQSLSFFSMSRKYL